MVDRQNQPAARRRALESRRVAKTCEARHAAPVTRACHRSPREPRDSWAMLWSGPSSRRRATQPKSRRFTVAWALVAP